MRKTIVLTALSCFLLDSNHLFAQEETELDPVTITTSLTPEKSSRTGRNVLIIKGEQFANLPIHSIDELLRYLPGMEVQARGPFGSQSDIVLRGGTFQQVLVIVDGLRLNDPNTGHFTSYIPIAPSEIERIEVLKGASSAVYGSEAVGGVIHIITKTFSAKRSISKSNAIAQITGGEYELLGINAGGFFSNGKTSAGGGLLSNNTSGQPQRGTKGSVYANTLSFSLGHHFNERWELGVRYSYDDRKFTAQNFYTTFVSDTANEKVATSWSQVSLIYKGNKDKVSLNVGYKNLDDEYKFNSASIANENNSKMIQVLLTDEWKLRPKTTIISGSQFISKKIVSNDRGDHNIYQAAVFAILNQQFGASFFANPGLRVEWNQRSGWEFVPQINLSYSTGQIQFRGSAGKTIRDADFTERYNNYNKVFVSSGRIGNPDLEAEHSFSYEAGADYFVSNDLKLSGTFFQRLHKKLIDYVPTPYNDMPRKINLSPTGSYALAKNISKVTTTGFETELLYTKQLNKGRRIWGSLGLTWLESNSSEPTPSFYISSHAKFLTNFNLQYATRWISFSANGLYKTRKPQTSTADIAKINTDYFVLNIKAEGFIWQNKLSVFIEADNLLDQNYADLLGAQMPGRWLMGGIKISLSK